MSFTSTIAPRDTAAMTEGVVVLGMAKTTGSKMKFDDCLALN